MGKSMNYAVTAATALLLPLPQQIYLGAPRIFYDQRGIGERIGFNNERTAHTELENWKRGRLRASCKGART